MKLLPTCGGQLLRWGRVLLLSAPLLMSCARDSSAEGPRDSVIEGTLVASNDKGGKDAHKKDAHKEADMKEVILHVFGMT